MDTMDSYNNSMYVQCPFCYMPFLHPEKNAEKKETFAQTEISWSELMISKIEECGFLCVSKVNNKCDSQAVKPVIDESKSLHSQTDEPSLLQCQSREDCQSERSHVEGVTTCTPRSNKDHHNVHFNSMENQEPESCVTNNSSDTDNKVQDGSPQSDHLTCKQRDASIGASSAQKGHTCRICGKTCSTNATLQDHLASHSSDRQFQCSMCSKSYKYARDLTRHKTCAHKGKLYQEDQGADSKSPGRDQQTVKKDAELSVKQDHHVEEPDIIPDDGLKVPGSNDAPEANHCLSGSPKLDDSISHENIKMLKGRRKRLVKNQSKWKKPLPAQRESFKCTECGKTFRHKHILSTHEKIHRGENPFECSICGKSCTSRGNLGLHMISHSKERPFKCNVCNSDYKYATDLKKHMRVHTGERPYSCSVCKKTFTRADGLRFHLRSHRGEKPYCCATCGKRFVSASNLKSHCATHTTLRLVKCEVCDKSFTTKANLKAHMVTHSVLRPHSCHICGKTFPRKYTLTSHLKWHEAESSQPYMCNICGKSCRLKCNLKVHMQVHLAERRHKCQKCNKGFLSRQALLRHLPRHTDDRPYMCSLCAKTFKASNYLAKHMKTHTHSKNFPCTVCDKTFTSMHYLKIHQRIHSGEKPYTCPVCSKGFIRKDTLRKHVVSHK